MPKSLYTDAQAVVAEVLTSARRDAGILQAELARRIRKDQSYISNIERGQRRVGVLEFYAIAMAMHVDPVVLYRKLVNRLPKMVNISLINVHKYANIAYIVHMKNELLGILS